MIQFSKYHGAGNDFIVIDDRKAQYQPTQDEVHRLCNRRFGIGADGLMLLRDSEDYDFEMVYFNADGAVGSMCGNGGRCIASFAHKLGVIGDRATFIAADGPHDVQVLSSQSVALKMELFGNPHALDADTMVVETGSPHFVRFVKDLEAMDVVAEGRTIRMSEAYRKQGINVNFVQAATDHFRIRTYERGVEDETLACGTGITAAAIAAHALRGASTPVTFHARGGVVKIDFEHSKSGYENLWKTGPVQHVYDGEFE